MLHFELRVHSVVTKMHFITLYQVLYLKHNIVQYEYAYYHLSVPFPSFALAGKLPDRRSGDLESKALI